MRKPLLFDTQNPEILRFSTAHAYTHVRTTFCFDSLHSFKWAIDTSLLLDTHTKGGSRHKNWCMARVLSFLIRYFSNYYTLHRSDLAARAAPLDPRLHTFVKIQNKRQAKMKQRQNKLHPCWLVTSLPLYLKIIVCTDHKR